MTTELTLSVTPAGLVGGFRYHDGRLLDIKRFGDSVDIYIESADAAVTTRVRLAQVSLLDVGEDLSDNLIGYIFIHAEEDVVRFTIEAIVGTDLHAVCKSVTAFPA